MTLNQPATKPEPEKRPVRSPVDHNSFRRRMHKRKTFEKKVVLMNMKLELLDTAMVQDISEGGACLRLDTEQWQHIPLNFMIYLTSDGSVKRMCEMVWRENRRIGVKFIVPKKPKPEPKSDIPEGATIIKHPKASFVPQVSKLFISSK
jgi:hypothetical protein